MSLVKTTADAYLIGPGFDLAIGLRLLLVEFHHIPRQTDGGRDNSGVWQITP
jgi:nucleoside-specific outer membrane channel protein Tsx